MISKRLKISKFIYGFKLFEAKNRDNFIETELLLFAANFVISNLSVQLSCQ